MTVVVSVMVISCAVLLGRAILSPRMRGQIETHATVSPGGLRHRDRQRVLILWAAIGGGHEAMASALQCELERAGHEAVSIDGLRSMSPRLDRLLRSTYQIQLEHAPWSYELIFHLLDLTPIAGAIRLLCGLLFGRRLQRIIERERPDLVVSTYPLVTATLGWLRLTGRLATPAVAVISDYGVHRLWTAPGIDRHLVVSAPSARAVQRAGSNSACVIRPSLAPAFTALPPDRAAARRALGIPEDALVTLITGGAWGVGALAETVDLAVSAGAFAVVVTGRNTRLRARLERRFHGCPNALILGWVNDMPRLMAAADCLIQNAGGVTCLEAIVLVRPIIVYRPIPGHGRLNARLMEEIGIARWARGADELREMLRAMVSDTLRLSTPCFESDLPASAAILSTEPLPATRSGRTSPSRSLPRPLPVAASLAAAALWITLSPGALAVTGRTLRLPTIDDTPAAGEEALVVIATDPLVAGALQSRLEEWHVPATLLVDERGARGLHPTAEISFGVVETLGQRHLVTPWRRRQAVHQAVEEIQKGTGTGLLSPIAWATHPAYPGHAHRGADSYPHPRPEPQRTGEPPSGRDRARYLLDDSRCGAIPPGSDPQRVPLSGTTMGTTGRSLFLGAATLLVCHAAPAVAVTAPGRRLFPVLDRTPSSSAVALTFDDGPEAPTEAFLRLLERAGATATFFFVGERVERAPSLALEIVRRGHEVGVHGYRHRNDLRLLP